MVLLPPDEKRRDGIAMEYVQKTVAAYDQDPQRFIDSVKDMSPIAEINKFAGALPTGGLMLDVGCASGRDVKLFVDKRFKTIGIDLSRELLKRAKDFSPQTQFLKMDARSLNFSNDYFNGIWCHATLLHLNNEDLNKTLQEFHRVLKENGILFASFKEGEGSEEKVESFSNDYPRFYNYQTVDKVKNLLEKVGFKSTEVFVVNEKDEFGKDKRDINWIYAFAKK